MKSSAYSQLLAIMKETATPDGDVFIIGEAQSASKIVAGGNTLEKDDDFFTLDHVGSLAAEDKVLMAYIDTGDDGDDYYVVLGKF